VITSEQQPFGGLNVLAVTPVGGYGGFNTSIHRVRAMESLGCAVQVVDIAPEQKSPAQVFLHRVRNKLFRQGLPITLPGSGRDQARLVAAARRVDWDVIWLEKAMTIGGTTIKAVRGVCPRALIVGFSPDDMNARHNQSEQFLQALPLYDWFITTKSYNVAELRQLGCPNCLFIGNGFDPHAFRPLVVGPAEAERLGGDVGFIGSYERERAGMMLQLATLGFKVRIWGDGWQKMTQRHRNLRLEFRPLYGDDFAKACASFKINLGFLRKINRDQQTTRSVEIPACGGFMLAERTAEHLQLYAEGEEAEFFDSLEELAAKIAHYLEAHEARLRIARAGLARCWSSGYSNAARLREALTHILRTTTTLTGESAAVAHREGVSGGPS
jgi:hypothetical protein